jgi:hypothetical protein
MEILFENELEAAKFVQEQLGDNILAINGLLYIKIDQEDGTYDLISDKKLIHKILINDLGDQLKDWVGKCYYWNKLYYMLSVITYR